MSQLSTFCCRAAATGALVAGLAQPARGQAPFDRTRDRGSGIASSQFGTYIGRRQLVVYAYGEYYLDNNAEYSPLELGYGLDQDFRGRYRAKEGLLFLGYGISDRLAVEAEVAVITATLDKGSGDPSALPQRVEQSGLSDVESQLRWRWQRETETVPEVYSYFETVFPLSDRYSLIGTTSWEHTLGTGIIRGFRWGTMKLRAAVAYADGGVEPGEYAIEYLKRVSGGLKLLASVEGTEDEVELITEAQVFLRPNIMLKLNNGVGLTSKAQGWAPEVGFMFFLP
jgi:hypothetical protein